ncbi:MAG: hypothetical protein JL50_07085 [Peptococcaceae bacterium BICA1-7]|nr:MAG: hypothetical protein JL50_07085 [Peptococcaceae bacterium BICA1-7]HBV99168.1 hypothetical protein [Desulfotomaculum sp.]
MSFFEWFLDLHKSNPILAGAFVPLYMAAVGMAFALVADIVVRLMGVHLGDYKKEYDDLLDEPAQENKTV